MRQKVPESGVLRACLDLLAAERIWHERRNTLPVLVDNGRGGRRPVRVAQNGTADIMATPHIDVELICDADEPDTAESWMVRWVAGYRHGLWKWKERTVLWIECKSDIRKQSKDQIEFERQVSSAGHHYLVVRSSDDLKLWLIQHGVIRRK